MFSVRPTLSPTKLSFFSRRGFCISSAYNPSRRLALFHLSSVIPQSQLLDVKASPWLRVDGNKIETSPTANKTQPSPAVTEENMVEWANKDHRRLLHVVYRVGDLGKTIKFYTECLGMKLLRRRDIPEEQYANAFLAYGPEDSHFAVELTYNYGVDKYDIGTGFGHFGVAVEDVAKTVDLVKAKGGKVTREPGPVKGGSTVIAFIEDPDGYQRSLSIILIFRRN